MALVLQLIIQSVLARRIAEDQATTWPLSRAGQGAERLREDP